MHYRTRSLTLFCVLALAACGGSWVGASTTGIIAGVVTGADNGAVLSGANVIVEGTTLSTVTDTEGKFVITNVPPGEYEVRVEMVGFAAQTLGGIQVTMDDRAALTFQMKQEATKEETVIVTRPRPMIASNTVNTLSLVTAQQAPLTRAEPANVRTASGILSALPGVTIEPNGSGQVHVRGGRSDQAGWYVEGIPISDSNTGMFSTNTYTTGLGKFQAFTGGFGAEYGNAISGILNEVKKTGADFPGFTMNLEGGSDAYRDMCGEFGGGSAERFNYYVAGAVQRTDLDGPMITQTEYTDNCAKLVWPSKSDNVMLLALQGSLTGSLDAYHDTGDNGNATPHERDFMQQRYAVSAVTWSHNFSPKSFVTVSPYLKRMQIVENLVGSHGMFADIASSAGGLQLGYTNQLNDVHLLKLGGSLAHSDNSYYLFQGMPLFRADVNTLQSDLYIQDQMKLGDKWTFDAGLRKESMSYDFGGREYVLGAGYSGAEIPTATESKTSPRLGLSYSASERSVWKVNWGRYAKFVPASSVQTVYFDPDMDLGGVTMEQVYPSLGSTAPETSTAVELSYERQLSDTVALRVTPFMSNYQNLGNYYTDPNSGTTRYLNVGEGKSTGIEWYLRKKMSNNWQGWVSYTYQKTEANRADLNLLDTMYPTSWDQRHTVALVTAYKAGDWEHSLRADFGSGRTDIGDPTVALKASPSVVVSYDVKVPMPKAYGLGQHVNISVFNLFNNHQTSQYNWGTGARVRDSWVPARSISVGFSSTY